MTPNQKTIHAYLDGFRATDREKILACLTDDVEWIIPGLFEARGKEEFGKHIVDEGFTGKPVIQHTRILEARDTVVVEGTVRAPRTDGGFTDLVFCDVFDLREGKIRRLVSYLVETKGKG